LIEIDIRSTKDLELIDVTRLISNKAKESFGELDGVLLCFVPHTTAAITINENADLDVRLDIEKFLNKCVPRGANYGHIEGNANAHIISTLIGSSVIVPVENSNLKLGRWQGIFFVEADGPRKRKILIKKL